MSFWILRKEMLDMAEITAIAPDGQGGVTVVDMTAQAIGKLDKELEAHKEPYAKIIIDYLKKRVAESNSLARDVMQEHKSWQRCWKYIYAKASKEPRQGRCAAIEDKVVFEWAEDYYIRDDKAEVEKEKARQAKQAKKAKTVKPDKKPAEKNEPDAKEKEAPAKEAEAPAVAKKTCYYKTGETYWKVEKGSPMPSGDQLDGAVKVTAKEYFASLAVTDPDEDAPRNKAPKREEKQEKKQRPKKNGQIEGQMSLADFMGGF